jgi:ribosomal protein S18 acetylase RimI-like enzyme
MKVFKRGLMLKIRSFTKNDIKKVVEIHMSAFEGFFLTSLGPRFLTEFYSALIDDPTGISILAHDEQGIHGFAVGTTKPSKFYRRLILSRSLKFFLSSIPAIVRNPRIIPHLLRGFLLPAGAARPEGWSTLLSLAVAKESQNNGTGHLLITSFISEVKQRELKKINLLTDKFKNDKVNNFYHQHDFRIYRSFVTPEGRWMNEYVLDLVAVENS